MTTRTSLAAALLCLASILPAVAGAEPWEVRREVREGARNMAHERQEAAREVRRCDSRDCVRREIREGHREVHRERLEARHEIRHEQARDYHRARYDAHRHANGRLIVHHHDAYYRGHERWYRDGRYWNRYDYVNRYYPPPRHRHHDDDDDDLVRGILIGAAAVGVIAAIEEAND